MGIKVTANGLLTLLIKRYAGPFWIRRRWLNKTQWLSSAELEKIQLDLLKRLVRHCYDTVPYYRGLMDERGISADSIRSLEDIKLFPILTKREVYRAGSSLVSTKYPKWFVRTAETGGTTGTPLPLRRSLFSIGDEHAFVRRQWDWASVGFDDRCAYLKAKVIGESESKSSRLYAYDPIMKELHLSSYNLSTETAGEYERLMKHYEVSSIVGYPSSVNLLARTFSDSNIKMKFRSVLLTSETLTEPTRNMIAETFDCKVFDFYGSAERVSYIHTCEDGSYHVIPEYGLTEMIPTDDGNDEQCRIVATGFWNLAMPLIRYDTEDIVVKSDKSCSCGRAFPVVESILGREGDVVRTPSGRELGVGILGYTVYILCCADNIIESQIIQDAPDHITIEYMPDVKFSSEDLSEFESRLGQFLPDDLSFTLKKVDRVRRTESGKVKFVVSLIDK